MVRSAPKRSCTTGTAADAIFSAMDGSRLAQKKSQSQVSSWRRLTALLACWRARAQERRLLAALDQRQLADIGVTRLDASRECAKPFWRA
jgi:uncharacterized protein YjiS (DUF1127 family)